MLSDSKERIVSRKELPSTHIDTQGRDLIVCFSEPKARYSKKNLAEPDLYAELNARLISYFLPLVQIAQKQIEPPRAWIVSGVRGALRWNATSEQERKIMEINTELKFGFLQALFNKFFSEAFSKVEWVVAHDVDTFDDAFLSTLWKDVMHTTMDTYSEVHLQLAKYVKPHIFQDTQVLSVEAKEFLASDNEEMYNAFLYALSHIFAFGDVNIDTSYVLNPKGFMSVGGVQEKVFNQVRNSFVSALKHRGIHIGVDSTVFDNPKVIVESKIRTPVPYAGAYKKTGTTTKLDEVTYENGYSLEFYDTHKKLNTDMDYIYSIIPREEYALFWKEYAQVYVSKKKELYKHHKMSI